VGSASSNIWVERVVALHINQPGTGKRQKLVLMWQVEQAHCRPSVEVRRGWMMRLNPYQGRRLISPVST
jgi:hypothetical protein